MTALLLGPLLVTVVLLIRLASKYRRTRRKPNYHVPQAGSPLDLEIQQWDRAQRQADEEVSRQAEIDHALYDSMLAQEEERIRALFHTRRSEPLQRPVNNRK